jgi:hypothetical protein
MSHVCRCLIALVAAITFLAPPAAAAQGEMRCAILGPLAIGAWIGAMQEVGGSTPTNASFAIQRLDRTTALYARMICPMAPLIATLECMSGAMLTGGAPAGGPTALASQCMTEANMPGAQGAAAQR